MSCMRWKSWSTAAFVQCWTECFRFAQIRLASQVRHQSLPLPELQLHSSSAAFPSPFPSQDLLVLPWNVCLTA